jgi:hypothetical protein
MTATSPSQPSADLPPSPATQPVHDQSDAIVPPTTVVVHRANGFGTAALVFGGIALALSIIPFFGVLAIFVAPPAILCGAIGAFKPVGKVKSHAGWIMGVLALLVLQWYFSKV